MHTCPLLLLRHAAFASCYFRRKEAESIINISQCAIRNLVGLGCPFRKNPIQVRWVFRHLLVSLLLREVSSTFTSHDSPSVHISSHQYATLQASHYSGACKMTGFIDLVTWQPHRHICWRPPVSATCDAHADMPLSSTHCKASISRLSTWIGRKWSTRASASRGLNCPQFMLATSLATSCRNVHVNLSSGENYTK